MTRGKFIVIEGLDGAGTTTQADKLTKYAREVQGIDVVLTAEPSKGPVGSMLRLALANRIAMKGGAPLTSDTLALLFTADRLDHIASVVEPALAAGKMVVCDRYVMSTLAYQAKSEADLLWLFQLNARAPKPDVTVFLRVPTPVGLARISGRGERDIFETEQFLARVERNYETVLAEADVGPVAVVDGTAPVQTVAGAIRRGHSPGCRKVVQ